ncbi:MAG: hypothetical protein PHE21_02130 [Candidatus Dojkabacteria bacterium]|nr:hypothetical protein [Candidatus Dojkabacteria bacterium]
MRKRFFNSLVLGSFIIVQLLIVFIIFNHSILDSGNYSVLALNKTNNWNFNGNSTGWSTTNGSGTNTCGDTGSTSESSFTTFAYGGSVGGQTAFQAITADVRNTGYRGMIYQTFTAPGSGTVKAKGKISYYTASTQWGSGWIRIDLYNSTNSTYIANLGCTTFLSDTSWTALSFGSDTNLTGGTTYAIRITFQALTRNHPSKYAPITVAVDNVVVNTAPTGLSASSVTDSKNASLSWTTSTAGSGANGLNGTTPYKVYRDESSPVSTFLANATTNSYTDSSTDGNTTYYYAISDVDTASDESPLSAESSVLTRPGAPTSLSFSNITSSAMRISWNAPTGGTGTYKIDRCTGTGCSDFSNI